jgi:hypothetical protein
MNFWDGVKDENAGCPCHLPPVSAKMAYGGKSHMLAFSLGWVFCSILFLTALL